MLQVRAVHYLAHYCMDFIMISCNENYVMNNLEEILWVSAICYVAGTEMEYTTDSSDRS